MNAQHTATPRPWRTRPSMSFNADIIEPVDGFGMIAVISDREDQGEEKANAAFIVRAVNSHEELVATLVRASQRITSYIYAEVMNTYGNHDDTGVILAERLETDTDILAISAAIKKAEG